MSLIVPKPTDGKGVAAVIVADTVKILLSLSGVNTHQIVNTLKDATGAAFTAVLPFTYISTVPHTVSVSASGLITALNTGSSIVEVSYPFAGNTIGTDKTGAPTAKISWDIEVLVVK
jgi:hypothetical protein